MESSLPNSSTTLANLSIGVTSSISEKDDELEADDGISTEAVYGNVHNSPFDNLGDDEQDEIREEISQKNTKGKDTKKRKRDHQKKVSDTQQYRCSLMAMINILTKIKEEGGFTNRQSQFLKQTPFGKFIDVLYENYLTTEVATKSSNNLDDLIECYCVDDESFKIGEKNLKMTPNDVSIIFGLPLSGKSIFPLPKMCFETIPENCRNFVTRNFGKIDRITRKVTTNRINSLLQTNDNQNEKDLPKLILILAIITFFFPTSERLLAWGYVQYIIDENKMNQVSWPLCIHQFLLRSLKTFKAKPRNMSGCSMLPLYFLCEHANIISPRKDYPKYLPRFGRWDMRSLKNLVSKDSLKNINSKKVFVDIRNISGAEKSLLEPKTRTNLQDEKKTDTDQKQTSDTQAENQIQSLRQHIEDLERKLENSQKELEKEREERKRGEQIIEEMKSEIKLLESKIQKKRY